MSRRELYCAVDDFWQGGAPAWRRHQLASGARRRDRAGRMSEREIMTLLILFHVLRYRDVKAYYTRHPCTGVLARRGPASAELQALHRGGAARAGAAALCASLHSGLGPCSGLSLSDATARAVCHNRRIHAHRVFRGLAARGKTSVGWFYGVKLHLAVNERGDLLAWRLTAGHGDDRAPVPALARSRWGTLGGDKGYLAQPLTDRLRERGLRLITKLRARMTPRLLPLDDALLLRNRGLIDSMIDRLKNHAQIEHARHRSLSGFVANLLAGLIAYGHAPATPSLHRGQAALLGH